MPKVLNPLVLAVGGVQPGVLVAEVANDGELRSGVYGLVELRSPHLNPKAVDVMVRHALHLVT